MRIITFSSQPVLDRAGRALATGGAGLFDAPA
jgi:hypothetical protein